MSHIKFFATLTLVVLPTAEYLAVTDQQHTHQEQADTETVRQPAALMQTLTASTGSELVILTDSKGVQIRLGNTMFR